MINVTKTYLPPFEEYSDYLKGIWDRGWLTNHGPLVLELEKQLRKYLDVKHIFFVNNGTIALQIAIKALELKGEIITTPFSYVATTSSIVWENCIPVFVDIEKDSLTIDVKLIESSITPLTSAILATHVYGNPCDVDAIKAIAEQYKLSVIYDAAHAFGVGYKGQSILNSGDISTISFHATKLFHTVEGGAVITSDDKLAHRISYMRNFGHNGQEDFWGLGINGKNSELHAAMGLCNLPRVSELIKKRKELTEIYDLNLADLSYRIRKPTLRNDCDYNFAYYPILFDTETTLIEVQKYLNSYSIFPRRYFYPSLNRLNYVMNRNASISEDVSKRVICLPLFFDLRESDVLRICSFILKILKNI